LAIVGFLFFCVGHPIIVHFVFFTFPIRI